MDILIFRDPRESQAKCSLTPLRGLPGIRFVDYDPDERIDAGERIFLHPEGDELCAADAGLTAPTLGLFLIDCSWRRVEQLHRRVDGVLHPRRLPELCTAYPRRSKTFRDPDAGLASVEALYAATCILGAPRSELLDEYRWREEFLAQNPSLR